MGLRHCHAENVSVYEGGLNGESLAQQFRQAADLIEGLTDGYVGSVDVNYSEEWEFVLTVYVHR